VQVNIKHRIDDVQCFQTVRALRWPEGIVCPSCASTQVIKRGFDDTERVLGSDGTSNRCKPAITFAELLLSAKKGHL